MKTIYKLPSGENVQCFSKIEAAMTNCQIENYFRHGIVLDCEGIVLDVGANIGLFTLLVSTKTNDQCHVIACEPIPSIFSVLECNVREWKLKNVECLAV